MALPSKLKNLNLFNDGNSYQGKVKSLTLPPLSRKFEAWRGGGMDGPVKIDLGHSDDGITLDWKLGGLDLTVLRQWGATSVSGVLLRFAGAYQSDDDSTVHSVEVVVRGRHEELAMGEAQPGADTEHSIKTTCSYYKLTVDSRVEIEIDFPNLVFTVDGVDILEAQRTAIGL